jgi:hypothetical protein
VGAVVALTYRATVDQSQRFVRSRAVGAHVGLTPKRYQSGEIDYDGGVSKCATPCCARCSTRPHTPCLFREEMVVTEGVGHAGGSTARDPSSRRRGR